MTKVLIIHTFGMGDIIMALPMIQMLAIDVPETEIEILITDKSAIFPIKNNPLIKKIIFANYGLKSLLSTIINLNKRKYDLSFVTSISFRSNTIKLSLFSYLIHAKKRYGELLKIKYPFYTSYNEFTKTMHRVQSNLNLLSLYTQQKYNMNSVFAKIYLSREVINYATTYIHNQFNDTAKIIAIHPGSNPKGKHRRWNQQYFVELIEMIKIAKPEYEFLVIAGPGEQNEGEYISKRAGIALINNGTLDQVAAILSKCSALINTDSGIGHIASAFNIKIFTIFGPGDFRKTSPHSNSVTIIKKDVECSPCLFPSKNCGMICLKELTPKIVYSTIIKKL